MKKLYSFLNLFVFCLSVSGVVKADVPPDQVAEVRHLLEFVKNSGCVINRNGTEHPAEEGVEHIEMKYDYYRDDIENTEDFIELAATKSTMSGDYYMVSCSREKPVRTRDWLLAELKRFRAEHE